MIRHATMDDLTEILRIYEVARGLMAERGNPHQWGTTYPQPELIMADIEKQELYLIVEDYIPRGVFMFSKHIDPDYDEIEDGKWLIDEPYAVIHRVAGDGTIRGLVKQTIEFCQDMCTHIRMDTGEQNLVMQHVLEKNGFKRCGIVHVEDGSRRVAYEYLYREQD